MSREFDGVDDVVDFGVHSKTATDFTMMIWTYAYSEGEGNAGAAFGLRNAAGRRIVLQFDSANTNRPLAAINFGSTNVISGADNDWPLNTWVHWAIRYRLADDLSQIIKNGVILASGNTDPGTTTVTDNLAIGAEQANGSLDFNGRLAFYHWFDSFLTDGEIRQLMHRPNSVKRGIRFYAPLWGDQSPEPDFSGVNRIFGTVTGALKSSNPPVGRGHFSRKRTELRVPSTAGGGQALSLSFSESLTVTENPAKEPRKFFIENFSLSESISKQLLKHLSDSLALTQSVSKETRKFFAESASLTEAVSKELRKFFSESSTFSESISKDVLKHFSDSASLSETPSKELLKHISDSIILTEAISKQVLKHFSDSVTMTESQALTIVQIVSQFVTFLLRGNIETHDKISMESDLVGTGLDKIDFDFMKNELVETGIKKLDDHEMENDQERLNWDFHNEI